MTAKSRRVLVAEDDHTLRQLLVEVLTLDGYETRSAAHGVEAFQVLEQWIPQVIVLDVMMPRMDAAHFRTTQRERPDLRDIPVILVSAVRHLDDYRDSLAPAAVISKPFHIEEFLGLVRSIVDGDQTSPPPFSTR